MVKSIKVGFLIGTPRSGKSRIFDILASTSEFAWVSQYQNRFDTVTAFSLCNRIYDFHKIGLKLYMLGTKTKFLPHPTETNSFWRKFLSKFECINNNQYMHTDKYCHMPLFTDEAELFEDEIKYINELIRGICAFQNKDIFLSEYSKWSRMAHFSQAFPDAKFVHIIRDGKAVAYEYHKMITNGEYVEWEEREWWIHNWPTEWKNDFLKNHNSILAFCAYLWKFQLRMIWEEARRIPNENYLEIRYENLINSPREVTTKILEFFGLSFNNRIEWYLEHTPLKNMNSKWKENLTTEQKNKLSEVIHETEYVNLLDDL